MSKDDKDSQTKHITSSLVSSDNWKNSEVVGLYMPTTIEFDLVALYKIAEEEGKKILIPKCLPNRKMIFAPYVTNELKKSKFGIMEPTNLTEVTPDYILVPGLAWNSDGYRIGFGGGYYDRYLKNFEGKTASVFYDIQSVEFEPESHDIMVQERFTKK